MNELTKLWAVIFTQGLAICYLLIESRSNKKALRHLILSGFITAAEKEIQTIKSELNERRTKENTAT